MSYVCSTDVYAIEFRQKEKMLLSVCLSYTCLVEKAKIINKEGAIFLFPCDYQPTIRVIRMKFYIFFALLLKKRKTIFHYTGKRHKGTSKGLM